MHPRSSQSGFSLVELSIVLVILGLLTGGILGGQALIRAAELRSVSSDTQRYVTAIHTFRDKYFSIPGDMTNATQFWGTDTASACSTAPVAGDRVAKTITCDGNGDGNLGVASAQHHERFRAWQQLANAGLIEGSYTGVAGPAGTEDPVLGENVPRAKINTTGFSFRYLVGGSTLDLFSTNAGTVMLLGTDTDVWTLGSAFKPEEAWNIDTKVDDGRPGFGKLHARRANAGTASNCVTSQTASIAEYSLSNSGILCALIFYQPF